jgi:hypothetical protein
VEVAFFPLPQETQNSTLGFHKKKTQKKTNERKEGEEPLVESQGKKKNTFNSITKERSIATLCLLPLLPLHKSHAQMFARAFSSICSHSNTTPPFCWDPTSTYYYVHAIEPSDRLHPLHRTVEGNEMMRFVLYKTC